MKKIIVRLILLAAVAVLPWVIMTAYMNAAGVLVPGEVVEKREAIVMSGGDSWKHIFEVTYQYRPFDSPYKQTSGHRIDPALYHRLHLGSTVQVRYSPSHLLRLMEGVGSFITDSSAISRLPYGPPNSRDLTEMAGIALASLIGFVAYRKKSKALAIVAGVVGATCIPVVLLAGSGLFLLPTLFWGWRRNPGKGYGWALLGMIALSAAVTYWRIPQPTPLPPGPLRSGSAIVRHAKVVKQIWSADREGHPGRTDGQDIWQPFQMLDLEFTPEGASEPIHVLDRIDLNSVPGLREGTKVPIYYSSPDPSLARIAGGTREFARHALIYLLALTYGTALVLAFLVFPAIGRLDKFIGPARIRTHVAPNQETKQYDWLRLRAIRFGQRRSTLK
jgi:hypothetical protein